MSMEEQFDEEKREEKWRTFWYMVRLFLLWLTGVGFGYYWAYSAFQP
jgi:hypothetical protein